MTTQQLLALDLLLVVLGGVLYAAAGIRTATLDTASGAGRGPARAALGCAGLALLVTAGRLLVEVETMRPPARPVCCRPLVGAAS